MAKNATIVNFLSGNGKRLIGLWDEYANAGYENIYRVRVQEEHRQKLGGLFLPANGGVYLDMGCGTGNMFQLVAEKIRPTTIYGVDWSEAMLSKARLEAERLQQNYSIEFKLYSVDASRSLTWEGNSFDGVVSNLFISYVTCGWKKSLEEKRRLLKRGGYLYLGTLLNTWGFTSVLWKHALPEFFREPLASFQGMKYRRIVGRISAELKKQGAIFPSRRELLESLEELGFTEIMALSTYWGGGIALRGRLS